jgi:hypothetical protein
LAGVLFSGFFPLYLQITAFYLGVFPVCFLKPKQHFSESSKEQKITRTSACNNGKRDLNHPGFVG